MADGNACWPVNSSSSFVLIMMANGTRRDINVIGIAIMKREPFAKRLLRPVGPCHRRRGTHHHQLRSSSRPRGPTIHDTSSTLHPLFASIRLSNCSVPLLQHAVAPAVNHFEAYWYPPQSTLRRFATRIGSCSSRTRRWSKGTAPLRPPKQGVSNERGAEL